MSEADPTFRSSIRELWNAEFRQPAQNIRRRRTKAAYSSAPQVVTVAQMDSHSLRPDQLAKLKDKIGPTVHYLGRLTQRIQQKGFPEDDRFGILSLDAYRSLLALFVELRGLEGKKKHQIKHQRNRRA